MVELIPSKEDWIAALKERNGTVLYDAFSKATVAVCGLGGLGSNIATALARAGVGTLILIDYDRVDITNLHRQQYKTSQVGIYKTEAMAEILKESSPYTRVITYTVRIEESNIKEFLKDADIICEAFDDAECKAMLVNYALEEMPDKFLVAASGMAGLESANSIQTRKITKRFYLCGDGVSEVDEESSLLSSRVMICAAHQAHMVLRILANEVET